MSIRKHTFWGAVAVLAISVPTLEAKAIMSWQAKQSEADKADAKKARTDAMRKMVASHSGRATTKVAYRNVSIIDGTGAAPKKGMAIIVEGDRISAILPNEAIDDGMLSDAKIVDAKGQFALPGLIDSHVHLATLPNREIAKAMMKRYLYAGITGTRDMAGDARALAELSRAALLNEIPAPDLFFASLMAGPDFFSDPRTQSSALGGIPGKLPWMKAITEKTDLPLAVAEARGTSATGIKIYANLPGNLVQAIIAEGKKQNIPVWSHMQVYPASPHDSIGATIVSHVCMIARNAAEGGKKRYGHDNPPSYAGIDAKHPVIKKYIEALVASGTIVDPTLSVYVPEHPKKKTAEKSEPRVDCSIDMASEITKAMNEAGVPIVAGTDRSTPADDPFPQMNVELELLVDQAGLTPMQAIMGATSVAARGLGKDSEIGTLEKGKLANFILVRDDPLKNISALRSIFLTVKRGHRFFRKDYHHTPIPKLLDPTE